MNWTEKYRPKNFDDIIGQKKVTEYYKRHKERNAKPKHAVYQGRCGIGKTTTARVIANEFGVDTMNINASQDRSLTFFREKVIPTMKIAPFRNSFRMIVCDEVESMLKEAWMVLKTPLEDYEHNTMVIFICNDSSGIPEAIYSRCDVFDFVPISKGDIAKKLKEIAIAEKLQVSDDVITTISDKAKNDMRKAITLLENYSKKALEFNKNDFDDLFVLTG